MKLDITRLANIALFIFINMNSLHVFSQNQQIFLFSQDSYSNQTIEITTSYDLQNRTVIFHNCTLQFSDNGKIMNGILGGRDNIIKTQSSSILNKVLFQESFLKEHFYLSWWYVPNNSDKALNNMKIQEVFNSIPNSSKLIFDKSYKILCDPVFTIVNKNGITIDFGGSLFYTDKSAGESSHFILLKTSNNIILNNLSVIGDTKYHNPGDKGEWGMGILIQGCKNVFIENSTINQCWGDNIYITGDKDYNPSENISITNCNLIDGRRNNVSIINANGVNIQSCIISKTASLPQQIRSTAPFAGIDLEPNYSDKEKVSNFSIQNSHIDLSDVGQIGILNYNNPQGESIYISNCIFSFMKNALVLNKSGEIIIDSCTFDNIDSNPIVLKEVRDIQVINNVFSSLPDMQNSVENNFQISNVSNYSFKNNLVKK